MAENNRFDRKTLKYYFRGGAAPKEEHFAALIDSMYNFVDDDKPEEPAPEPVVVIREPSEDPSVTVGEVEADGVWHDLPVSERWKKGVSGCWLFHLVAGYKVRKGVYRMSEATASLCEGRWRRLSSPQRCVLGFWKSPVRFRWKQYDGGTFLQIKACKRKASEARVHFRLKEVWNYVATD